VSLAGQRLEHGLGLTLIVGLAVDTSVEDNLGVDSKDVPLTGYSGDRPSLALGMPLDFGDRLSSSQLLFVLRDDRL